MTIIDVLVFGSVVLDVVCFPVDDVPRYDCIGFEKASVAPGGCASNVAVGLSALGIKAALAARLGTDDPAELIERFWKRAGLYTGFINRQPSTRTGISIGLVDSSAQARFLHTPGSSGDLSVDDLPLESAASMGARALIVTGPFILPDLMEGRLAKVLAQARSLGMLTTLDAASSPQISDPTPMFPCLPHLDYMLCNTNEARHLTGLSDQAAAARELRRRGALHTLVKIGKDGVWAESSDFSGLVPSPDARVVDTTGAGDAFLAAFSAAILNSAGFEQACRQGAAAGARTVEALGAISAWEM